MGCPSDAHKSNLMAHVTQTRPTRQTGTHLLTCGPPPSWYVNTPCPEKPDQSDYWMWMRSINLQQHLHESCRGHDPAPCPPFVWGDNWREAKCRRHYKCSQRRIFHDFFRLMNLMTDRVAACCFVTTILPRKARAFYISSLLIMTISRVIYHTNSNNCCTKIGRMLTVEFFFVCLNLSCDRMRAAVKCLDTTT